MRQCMEELKIMLESHFNIIWINTYEENAFIKDLRSLTRINYPEVKIKLWSMTEGLKKIPLTDSEKTEEADPKFKDASLLLKLIKEEINNQTYNRVPLLGKDNTFYVLRDFHIVLEGIQSIKRAVRDFAEYPIRNYQPIFIVAPSIFIPNELSKIVHVFDYDLLSKEEVTKYVSDMVTNLKKANLTKGRNYIINSEEEIKILGKTLTGLTENEIMDVMKYSIKKYNCLSINAITEQKIELIKRSGVLDFRVPRASLSDIGGNKNIKNWINDVKLSMTEEAKQFGCKRPKGYLALGIPGCSKSLMAEAIAKDFNMPLIELKLSRIMNKLVGESEKKIEQALKIMEACAPCICLIDEVEKNLGGISSSNSSDSGTVARVFSQILLNMEKDNGVFTIMTSNDVSQLPPELTRAGRLDALFYFSVPTAEERKEIFKIHLDKTKVQYDESIIDYAVNNTENYTGAEIESIVKTAVWKAFRRFTTDNNNAIIEEDIESAIKSTIPIYESSREKIMFLENWVKGRALYANEIYDENGFNNNNFPEIEFSL